MLKESLIQTIMVATEHWLGALKEKDMECAMKIRAELDGLQMQLNILNEIERGCKHD